jgi:hypothetical protein
MTGDHSPNTHAETSRRWSRSTQVESEAALPGEAGPQLEAAPAFLGRFSRVRDHLPRDGARLVHRLQAKVGNQAVRRLVGTRDAGDGPAIQRQYTPNQAEVIEQDAMITKKWGQLDKDLVTAKSSVNYWCQSHAQFLSLVNNLDWEEFKALKKKYKSGSLVPTKIAAIRAQMAREMKTELEALQKQKEEARRQQIEKFRTTGQPGVGMTYAACLKEGIISGIVHAHTFRTDAEKADKKGHPTGPFTRNFSVRVNNQPALWEIHVHYKDSVDQQVTKAHVKLISERHTHEHIRELGTDGVIVQATNPKITKTVDNTLTDL